MSIMDIQLPSFPILIASFIFILAALTIWKKKSARKLPPGPRKLPLIGNMHLFSGAMPHRRLRDLAQQYGPIMHLQLGQLSTVVVSSPEAAQQFMKIHDAVFAQRPFLLVPDVVTYGCSNIVFSKGEYWKLLRKVCTTDLLSAKCVQSYRSIREEEISRYMKLISSSAGSPINLTKTIFSMIFGITARAAFGQNLRDQEEFIETNKEGAAEFTGDFVLADLFPSYKFLEKITGVRGKLEKIHDKFDRIADRMVNERRSLRATTKTENPDLLDALLYVQKHGELDFPFGDDQIKAVILDILSAGTEAPAAAVEWAMSELVKNPSVMEKAQAEVRKVFGAKGDVDETGLHELTYLKLVIKEIMRTRPPIPLLLPRESAERCEIFGYEIPAKSRIIINVWALGRDPKHWSEPERFMPERFADSSIDYKGNNFEYIPFGAGRRMCPGIQFGIASIEMALAQLLFHFDWKLPNGVKPEELDMNEHFSVTVQRKEDLYVIPVPAGLASGRN